MAKIASDLSLAGLKVDKQADSSLHVQLYENIREAILTGRLSPGQKLPASRALADELAISRNTVTLAFEQLTIEGYLTAKTGAGTFVATPIPEKLLYSKKASIQKQAIENTGIQPIHPRYGLSQHLLDRNKFYERIIPFQTAIPAFDAFPFQIWSKIAAKVYRNLSSLPLGYGDAAGYRPLREAIAGYLRAARAVNCQADNILIVNGSQQGLQLVAKLLLQPGSKVWMEDPGYHGARAALQEAGSVICPIPVGKEGLQLDYAIAHHPQAKLVYLTPSHQYPLGGTMPLPQRLRLLEYARKEHMWILEDDYDSELRFVGRPLASLQGLDQARRVIYVGTFSKVLFPALRLAYLVIPSAQLMDAFTSAKAMADRQNPVTEQAILAEFIAEGHFARHLRRMRVLYQQRQEVVLRAAQTRLAGLLEVEPAAAGMHVVGWLPEGIDEKAVVARTVEYGLITHLISDYAIYHKTKPGLLLGYTSFDNDTLTEGISTLEKALRSLQY
ncbi:PLP-dependent aminotransferase family protein [Rhodocytophaga rosea]|uniref:PLP-dependent aminotransferase family protein n=1 Tax=Rhodocytophaga rosea TaxID=2704465 RepID=A0A6C0GFL3_9BACT|nr:PLP-dependent aminotransferase family protein [Rhodocytophaga rosea]QHT66786.1 PLP-dependent aminotransferase family protein [Rhodocytophaga rosea]